MFFYPFVAALLTAGDIIYEKYVFTWSKLKNKQNVFVPVMFMFAFIFLAIFVVIFPDMAEIKADAYKPVFLLLMLLVVAVASLRNMLYYYSFQREGLGEIEPFMSFVPLLTILIAGIVYPQETNIQIFALAIIAALALVLSHIKKRHLFFDKALWPIFIAIILEAVENNLVRELLRFYSPVSMYMIRSFFIAIMLMIFIRPQFKKANNKEIINLAIISLLWVFVMVFTYYAYQTVGVVYTSLIMMLSPMLIVFGSRLVLKDKKLTKRNFITLIIIIACVIAAQFVK
ncbi:MAG TPA: EamA family transporter [Patescibacteria group bacterium]|nr:EamA family transporter [Patescibacteria group bacterium]